MTENAWQGSSIQRWYMLHYYLRLRPPAVPLMTFAFDMVRYVFAEGFVRDKVVLDAATGKGYGAYHLARAGKATQVLGVDLDEGALEYARSLHRHRKLRFERMDVTCMRFPAAYFDVVVSFETLEHICPANTTQFMGEVVRVLKPDGVFVISTPNRPVYSAISRTRGHVNEMDFEELRSLLSSHFSDFRFYYQGRPVQGPNRRSSGPGRALTAMGMVSRRLPRLSIALLESASGKWASERRLGRLLIDRRVRPASSAEDVRRCLFQLAVCRKPGKSC